MALSTDKLTNNQQTVLDLLEQSNNNKNFKVEYLEIADSKTLEIHKKINSSKSYRAFICVNINDVRLIDNLLLN